jgi:hypothetical protein
MDYIPPEVLQKNKPGAAHDGPGLFFLNLNLLALVNFFSVIIVIWLCNYFFCCMYICLQQ